MLSSVFTFSSSFISQRKTPTHAPFTNYCQLKNSEHSESYTRQLSSSLRQPSSFKRQYEFSSLSSNMCYDTADAAVHNVTLLALCKEVEYANKYSIRTFKYSATQFLQFLIKLVLES